MAKLISFGYKHGQPPLGATVLDVRHFRNPWSVAHLRVLPGTHWQVARFISGEDIYFQPRYYALLHDVTAIINRYDEAVIYIGCTGGQHRSVYLADRLAFDLSLEVAHRDLAYS